jgi:hypothetical protein
MRAAPILIPRPDPLTALVPVWGALWGVVGAATALLAPADVSAAIPRWGVYGFFLGMLLSSIAVLLTLRPKYVRAVRWSIRAWLALGSVTITYSGWAAYAFGLRGYVVISLLLTIGVASFWQAWRLNTALNPKE